MKKLEADAPLKISVGLDAWTSQHHGYMGMNAHYLNNDWERVIFNLACTPFDTNHTGENIYWVLHSEVLAWGIMEKMGLCLRDNDANMVCIIISCSDLVDRMAFLYRPSQNDL